MTTQRDDLPNFDNPPVIETILGVQFAQIPNLTSAHFGWYWREFWGESWVRRAVGGSLPKNRYLPSSKPRTTMSLNGHRSVKNQAPLCAGIDRLSQQSANGFRRGRGP